MVGARVPTHLTPKEIDCLYWASRGKTSEVHAQFAGRATITIIKHRASAILKLGTANITHACCEALRRGYIACVLISQLAILDPAAAVVPRRVRTKQHDPIRVAWTSLRMGHVPRHT